ncbi:MAG: DUF1552 domain-containing protein [Planctomycetaceae bacterium]
MSKISRRTALRGTGVALALPLLEGMLSRRLAAAEVATTPTRLAFVYIPCGAIMKDWTPEQTGTDFTMPRTLAPLEAYRDRLLVLSGLAHDKARANGDGAGDHARDSAAFLTGAQPRKTAGADLSAGISVDQVAANKIGLETRFPSLELGTEAGRQAGNCDSGYSCAYSSNISWKSASQPLAKEINPRAVFDRLFGNGAGDAKAIEARNFYRQSILDFVADDADRLRAKLGQSDRRKLDEYFTSVREVEQRVESATIEAEKRKPDFPAPSANIPRDYAEHVRLMYDLLALAFRTDSTRIGTFMLGNSGSNRTYREIAVKGGHHELSHHRGDEDKIANLQRIDQYMIEQFAYFLKQLKSTPEGDGTLLDHTMIVYGGSLSDANRHQHDDLPVLVAGGGGGTLQGGRHLQVKEQTPMANLFLSLLDRVGVQEERFGDSTGRLAELG